MILKESKKAAWKGFEKELTKIKDVIISYVHICKYYANIYIYYLIPYYTI